MKKQILGRRGLADLELRIEAKYRELARQEYESELQRLADGQGRFSPLDGRADGGTVNVVHGRERSSGKRGCPFRDLIGLARAERMSPALQDRACWFSVAMGSYCLASQGLSRCGIEVDDSTLHAHVQRVGQVARQRSSDRIEHALEPATRPQVVARAAHELQGREFSLVIMLDGWMARERGEQWGAKPPEALAQRVAWHEVKSAIVFRLEERLDGARPQILSKYWAAWRGDPQELGRRVHAEALRRGLAQARRVFVVADGGVWIWNIVEDRFSHAWGVLDFSHASQHLWAVAHALHGHTPEAEQWVAPMLHQLRHGDEVGVLKTLDDLTQLCAQLDADAQATIQRERRYFHSHREHLRYAEIQALGCPCGSGAMESTCAQWQRRLKGVGKFWTPKGLDHIIELELARRNGDWDELWN
jgi:hypothetical protein